MGRPRQISDEQISAAARACFLAHGPGAPVSLVAEKLGVSQAALFQRAGSKEHLMLQALCPSAPQVLERLSRPPAAETPAVEQLVGILEELHAFFGEVVPGLLVLRAAGVPLKRAIPAGTPPPLAVRRLLATWLGKAHAEGSLRVAHPRETAEALLGSLEARCFNAHVGGAAFVEGTDKDHIRRLVNALVPAGRKPAKRRK